MIRKFKHIIIIIAALILSLVSAIITEINSFTGSEAVVEASKPEETIKNLCKLQDSITNDIINRIVEEQKLENYFFDVTKNLFKEYESGIFIYQNDTLQSWSTNRIPAPIDIETINSDNRLIKLSDGWYLKTIKTHNNLNIIGLCLISHDYSYQNELLSSNFNKTFNLPCKAKFSSKQDEHSYEVKHNDTVLFYINYANISPNNYILQVLSLVFWIISTILFLTLLVLIFKISAKITKLYWLLLLALCADLIILRFLMLKFGFPTIFYQFKLFSPELFAQNFWLPSLGDYLINAICFFVFAAVFQKYFTYKPGKANNTAIGIIMISVIGFSLIFYSFIIDSFNNLVINSSIEFTFASIINISAYSIVGLTIILLIIFSFLLIFDRIIRQLESLINYKIFIPLLLVLSTAYYFLFISQQSAISLTFFIFVISIVSWIRLTKKDYSIYSLILIIIAISMISAEEFTSISNEKEEDIRKVLAANLANERDAGAEFFITILNHEINDNKELTKYVMQKDHEKVYNIIYENHFKKYLNKYDLQISICEGNDSLFIKPDDLYTHCLTFFSEILSETGIPIPETNFYYLDNHNGRISYFGYFQYLINDSTQRNLFIEIDSKIFSEGLGYPELLLDKAFATKSTLKAYSFAKYNKGRLIDFKGTYEYPLVIQKPENQTEEYYLVQNNNYSHLYYTPDPDTIIVISLKRERYSTKLVAFSIIFFILFIINNLIQLLKSLNKKGALKPGSMKNKIQVSIMSILLLSLILTGSISYYFILEGYKQRQIQNLQDKVRSVQVEVEHKIGNEPYLSEDIREFTEFSLIKFSNVFFTDINIYDLNGLLFASSRNEIYENGLQGRFIKPQAIQEFKLYKSGMVIIEEQIGKLKYLSAYIPFRNYNNEVIAYLNLPYFAHQDEFQKEISEFIIAFTNVFMILLLVSILIGVFIGNQLTKPLALIQEKIRTIDIGKKGEKIDYKRRDELGGLIKEYNRKIDELAISAQKLAQSERESAWREMAKQIAHEIKNPLTPMKLSVQHLVHSYEPNNKDWQKTLDKMSKTIIEQIDTLSAIATEFSNFAKMPIPINERVNLIHKIYNTSELFKQENNITINFITNNINEAIITADKEQILRVFNNLLKNSIQAIPDDQHGIITIEINEEINHYILKIADNGTGISDEMKPKIFQPNFTTKSSGMGLGLSMVRNIIANIGGEIWFETELGQGTSFYIRFPKPDVNP
ncbi:MAG: ATP-binding protein [Bacteroidales bacterium]|nr:ATP-binding protein [Bacteroidales bacterium]